MACGFTAARLRGCAWHAFVLVAAVVLKGTACGPTTFFSPTPAAGEVGEKKECGGWAAALPVVNPWPRRPRIRLRLRGWESLPLADDKSRINAQIAACIVGDNAENR